MIITREKGMRMWGGGSGSTSASGVNGGGGFSLAVTEGEGTGNAYTGFTYESGVLSLIKGTQFVTTDFFNRLFTAYDANGTAIVPNDTTTAISNLKIMVGTWTEQYLSALGLNSEGGGGGGTGSVNSIKVATNTYLDPDADGIIDMSNYVSTAADRANWNTAYSQRHTHSNKSVLDGITSAKVTSWDNVAKIMEDDADAIINKWDEIIDFLDGIPDQSTLAEILAAKANSTVQIIAGNGLTGGGNLQANRTINVASANAAITVNADNIQLNVINDYTTTTNNTIIPLAAARGKDLNDRLAVLESWFEVDSNGDIKTKDKPNGTHRGFYTESFVSALGSNSEGGGSSTFDEDQMWEALGTNTTTKVIATSHIPDMASTYGYLKSSALNGYATQTWVNQQGFLTTHQTLYTLSIYGGTTKVLDFKPNANASIYIKAGGDISLTNDTTNKYITLSYTHPTNGANTTISAASGKVLSAITVNSLGHVTSVSSKTLASADIPDISATYATASRATTLEGYFTDGVAKTAAKLNTGTTTYTAWGQTYWSSGVPQSVSGNMTSVGSITPSANGNALGTTSARFNIYGTSGNYSSTLTVADAITLSGTTAAKKRIYFGDTSHYLELDSTGFHFSHGVYSDSFVSALGANSSGGGSGTFDEEAMWEALGTTSTAKVIASSHIPNLAASKITSGTFAVARIPDLSGRYYALYGGTPLNATSSSHYDLNGLLTVGSYYCSSNATAQYFDNKPTNDNWAFRVWVSAPIGTSSTYVRQRFQYYIGVAAYERYSTDSGSTWTGWFLIQVALANYLPLSGGTLTGALTISTDVDRKLIINNTDTDTKYSLISFRQNGTEYGTLGTRGTDILSWNGYGIINTNNIGSYAPSLTGTGASGTWGISVSGNATTATTLQTSRTIWGQSFDGSGNVSGQMSNVGHIYPASTGSYNIGSRTNYFNSLFGINITLVDNTTDEDMVLTWKSVTVGGSSERVFTMYAYETKYSDIILGQSGSIAGGGIFYDASADSVGIGTYTPAYKLDVNGTIRGTNIISSVATGTAPLTVASSTVVSNLNADLLDGQHASYFAAASSLSNYVTLATNQTISGAKTFTNGVTISSAADNKIIIDNTDSDTNYSHISFRQNGTEYGWLGISATDDLRWLGNILLHAGNYNSYAPSLTGTGASGTWGISISGTAAQANQVSDYQSGNGAFFASCQRGIGSSNTGALVYAYGSNPIRFYTNSTEKMRIAADGSVGIGTDSPSYKLHVYGQVGITAANSGTIRLVSAKSINYIQSGNEAFDDNADMIISGHNASKGTNLTLNFNTVNVTNVLKVKTFLTLGYDAEGIYLTGTGIYWHNASNAWTKTIMGFASTGATSINGNLTVFGEVTATSDARKKNIISNTKFNVKDIASARSIIYEWKDRKDKIHGGSIAQDWLGKADSFLSQDNDGWYSINYGALALCSAITIAREVLKHSDEIDRLKQEVSYLKARVAELEERRA